VKNNDILISGGGIAGPALAYWLRRYGLSPTVIEQAPAQRPGGQAVDLRGAAREVADRMGILGQVRQAHTGTRGLAYVDDANRRLASLPADLLGDSGGAIAEAEILRSDLAGILHAVTRDDIEYIFDEAVTEITQDADGAKVTFQRGAPRTFDLVVGADGLHSSVRGLTFGPEPQHVRDLGAYVAIFTTTSHLDLDGWELMHSTPGRTAGLYPVGRPTRPRPPSTSSRRRWSTTAATSPSSSGYSPRCSPDRGGRSLGSWRPCGRRRTSTSTGSARCTWSAGRLGGSCWSGTPPTARRHWRA
jgi:2-polyprenyl-6-methoxyphenol hydroxylase-like FAD-dependent oxidoreductase